MLLNPAKCQGYSFYCLWVIKKKTAEEGVGPGADKITSPHPY